MTAVVWRPPDRSKPGRGYWDQTLLEGIFDRSVWHPVRPSTFVHYDTIADVPAGEGAVVVCPGAYANPHELRTELASLAWVLLIVTSDEENHLALDGLLDGHWAVGTGSLWLQYANPEHLPDQVDRLLPIGYGPDTPEHARVATVDRTLTWAFAGQVTNGRRRKALEVMRTMGRGALRYTPGFGQGVSHEDYVAELASAIVAPCPPGPYSPDSFRLGEALEVGAVPVVDAVTDRGRAGLWDAMLGEVPFPVMSNWRTLPSVVNKVVADWPRSGALCSAWWQATKRDLAYALEDTVARLSGTEPAVSGLADLVTVVVPTSPIPSHPDTAMLRDTLASVAVSGLGDCEVLITCDGVRAAQADRRGVYDRYVAEVVRECEHSWWQTLPIVHERHEHQARMMGDALERVRTPLVLYVEHDAPLCGEFDWDALCGLLLADEADVVRFHHDELLLPEHEPLMLGPETVVRGVPVRRTAQWSQRPHLAVADYYRRVLAEHFAPVERWMIEDRMCSVLEVARNADMLDRHRIMIYTADNGDPGIRHSRHLDGRAGDPKWTDR